VTITEITLNQYRSWARLSFVPDARLNLLVGANAQGKSNLLEALYTLVTTRPYRAAKDAEAIRFGEDYAHVHVAFTAAGRQLTCELAWQKGRLEGRQRKEIRVNRHPVERLLDVFGLARMVLFTPRDLDLIQGSPDYRRRYLDILLCQLHPAHLYALNQYHRVLQERNRWLRSVMGAEARLTPEMAAMYDALTEQLVRWGADIMERRHGVLARLVPLLERTYRQVGGHADKVSLRYVGSVAVEPGERMAEALHRVLRERLREERARGATLYGPHRDDLAVLIDGRPVRHFGSQGQIRTCALAMRLAEGELLEADWKEPPVFLLDDCLSEIDPQRQDALWAYLARRQQVFLTTTSWDRALPIPGALFAVEGGQVKPRMSSHA
jgi:DNA replication and repair protein RecF